ncbi:MAG: ribonuclease III [Mariprofundales bacterium]
MNSEAELKAFAGQIGYQFRDLTLLEQALTHCSAEQKHNERLEFLGDAVLELVISAELFQCYSDHAEGDLTRMRARLVDRSALSVTAKEWRLSPRLHVSKGERGKNGLPRAESVVANAVEAVIGAVYLDGGYAAAKKLVVTAWQYRLSNALDQPAIDAKTALQEWTQHEGKGLPEYHCDDLGVDRSPRFHATCLVGARVWGKGRGGRKKDAEQHAARVALAQMKRGATDG